LQRLFGTFSTKVTRLRLATRAHQSSFFQDRKAGSVPLRYMASPLENGIRYSVLKGILEEGGRGEGAQRTGAATAPVRLVHGVGASAGREANPVGKAVHEFGDSIEHIELLFANRAAALYPCGFRLFLGVKWALHLC
jgi:hypothetical protein